MQQCVRLGCDNEGVLPGRLKVKRRAPSLYRKLQQEKDPPKSDGLDQLVRVGGQ